MSEPGMDWVSFWSGVLVTITTIVVLLAAASWGYRFAKKGDAA